MRKENNTPHMGMIVALGALIAAIWMLAIYDTIQDAHEEKYDVSVRPGAVSYGTHSSAMIPMVSAPSHTSAPMISGSAIRSYAHYGHAAYTVHHTPYTVHTTSSATVHTIGSGGGASGGGSSPSGDRGASSRGISYGGASVSMPSFALTQPTYAFDFAQSAPNAVRPRRVIDNGGGSYTGEYEGEYNPATGLIWDDEEMEWRDPTDYDSYTDNSGNTYEYQGGAWVLISGPGDPTNTPLGDAPWHWMLLLALAYGIAKMVQRKRIHG